MAGCSDKKDGSKDDQANLSIVWILIGTLVTALSTYETEQLCFFVNRRLESAKSLQYR